jgi:hypothetical protein
MKLSEVFVARVRDPRDAAERRDWMRQWPTGPGALRSAAGPALAVLLLVLGAYGASVALVPAAYPPRGVPAGAAILDEAPPRFERGPGGLGLTEAEWRRERRDGLHATFVDGRVAAVSRPCGAVGCSLQGARAEAAATLLPEDARPLRTETRPNGAVVDVFASPSSAGLWPAAHWRRRAAADGPVEAGTLSATYTLVGGYVLGFRVETGEP